jgi:membrane-bound lytic murein transglycosylase D
MVGKTVPVNSQLVSVNTTVESEGEYIIYTVRNGDNIWNIVKMYDDVSASQVLSLNNISDASRIQVGQKLKIKKKV